MFIFKQLGYVSNFNGNNSPSFNKSLCCELMFCCYALGIRQSKLTFVKTSLEAIKFVTMQFSAKKGLWPNQETLNDQKS